MSKCIIGIDPGVKSGFAMIRNGRVIYITTVPIWDLFTLLNHYYDDRYLVVVEDARKRKWFGKDSVAKREGAGWIKTLCGQIEAFLIKAGVNHKMIHPIKGGTKLNADMIAKITDYKGRTNEHERDAIMIALSQAKP